MFTFLAPVAEWQVCKRSRGNYALLTIPSGRSRSRVLDRFSLREERTVCSLPPGHLFGGLHRRLRRGSHGKLPPESANQLESRRRRRNTSLLETEVCQKPCCALKQARNSTDTWAASPPTVRIQLISCNVVVLCEWGCLAESSLVNTFSMKNTPIPPPPSTILYFSRNTEAFS